MSRVTHAARSRYVAGMENETPRTPRNDVYNSIAGDVDPDASVIQSGHHRASEEPEDSGAVYNSIGGSVRGNASVIQTGDITGDISL